MPIKHWSSAGLILTYWCSARCASCYLSCAPDRADEMSVEDALSFWGQLIEASPHGCRIHLTGGEPFGDYLRLIELSRRAKSLNLQPLQKVETSAFWADDDKLVRERVGDLAAAGMQKICISTDPYHQQFVPIEFPRRLARIAEDMLGSDRVQVRWADWLEAGYDTDKLSASQRRDIFVRYASDGRDRMNGRAGDLLAPHLQCKVADEFVDMNCREALLRSRHVHIDGSGRVTPGTCAGIVLGTIGPQSVAELWKHLDAGITERPILAALVERGPVGLLDEARDTGYELRSGYAGKCHLCWEVRCHFVLKNLHRRELAPAHLYRESVQTAADCRRKIRMEGST
jgi:hypothetical protein